MFGVSATMMGPGQNGTRNGWGHTAVELRVRDGGKVSHQLFRSIRLAVRAAEALHEAGREVQLISSAGRVLLHYQPRNARPMGPNSHLG